ncbi:MAG TPA: hypothetical protein VFY82_13440 [Acidimicrobiales bacterium]|nr:hypothetical protein [Acidimicrobiales bacterium]
MRRTFIALAAAGALALTGCSDSDSGDPNADDASADGGSGGNFCDDFQALDERFADDPEAAADPEVVIEALEALDPPDEIAEDYDVMLEASRNTADVDQSDPEAMADAQAEIEAAGEAQARVFAYLDEECGVTPGGG